VIACELCGRFLEFSFGAGALAPSVTEPDGGEEVEGRGFRSMVGRGDAPEHVIVISFGDFLHDVEEAVFMKNAGILEFILTFVTVAFGIFFSEEGVRIACLWVAIERLCVRVSGSAVFVVVAFFDVLAVIALVAGEAKEALFQDAVIGIPKSHRKTDATLAV